MNSTGGLGSDLNSNETSGQLPIKANPLPCQKKRADPLKN